MAFAYAWPMSRLDLALEPWMTTPEGFMENDEKRVREEEQWKTLTSTEGRRRDVEGV